MYNTHNVHLYVYIYIGIILYVILFTDECRKIVVGCSNDKTEGLCLRFSFRVPL